MTIINASQLRRGTRRMQIRVDRRIARRLLGNLMAKQVKETANRKGFLRRLLDRDEALWAASSIKIKASVAILPEDLA